MLHFSTPLTPAATELLISCLEFSTDMARSDTLGDEWAIAYPLSAKCFTRQRAREVLLDLVDKVRLPQTYVPTSYHWLLLYECLQMQIECLNDDMWPDFVNSLKTARDGQDAAYFRFPRAAQGVEGFWVDFEAFIDVYFWDTDFLLDPSTYYRLGAPSRNQLGYRADLFGVLSGLPPHPTELILQTVDEVEAAEPEGDDGDGELE
jgi:hypothetical protein